MHQRSCPATKRGRRFVPAVEELEVRNLLANGFLQGTAFLDLSHTGTLTQTDP
jgi:hypothetical protein